MTRKHYEAVAAIVAARLAATDSRTAGGVLCDLAADLADAFQAENPRFDRLRFFAACGI